MIFMRPKWLMKHDSLHSKHHISHRTENTHETPDDVIAKKHKYRIFFTPNVTKFGYKNKIISMRIEIVDFVSWAFFIRPANFDSFAIYTIANGIRDGINKSVSKQFSFLFFIWNSLDFHLLSDHKENAPCNLRKRFQWFDVLFADFVNNARSLWQKMMMMIIITVTKNVLNVTNMLTKCLVVAKCHRQLLKQWQLKWNNKSWLYECVQNGSEVGMFACKLAYKMHLLLMIAI